MEIQVREICYSCLYYDDDSCEFCDSTGYIFNWITVEDLMHKIERLKIWEESNAPIIPHEPSGMDTTINWTDLNNELGL